MPGMTEDDVTRHGDAPSSTEIPDRLCTWCKVPMTKRLVGGGQFIHWTCPKCVFQHTAKRSGPEG